jgi:hypothetical protein
MRKTAKWSLAVAFSMSAMAPLRAAFAEVSVPETAADHQALAKQYSDEATAFRKVAAEQREKAATYNKGTAGPSKSGTPNPWAKKMADQCGKMVSGAETLAVDAQKSAEYHTLRAQELAGR